jgi:pimeloyl-ACP methyl ester carboxylesterase
LPHVRVNGVNLYYQLTGSGDPLVLVHGAWGDHTSWQLVVPELARSFRVLTYDRRGHSQSERPAGQGFRAQDEDDLGALIETLDLAPAHVVGNSFGASTALGLASRRPELFRSLVLHEPPLMGIVAGDEEFEPLMKELQDKTDAVLEQLEAGDIQGGTRRFVEEIAFGPGMWEQLPEQARQTFMNNAPTFLDEQRDPSWADLDPTKLLSFSAPALLTHGDQSPPWFPVIITRLAEAMEKAQQVTVPGAGHAPHRTHPALYAQTIAGFIQESQRSVE